MLGVDPGLVETGYGVLETGANGLAVLDMGVITTPGTAPLPERLYALHAAVHGILGRFAPALLVLEDLYSEYKFPRTAILMGHARGVVCLAACQRQVPVLHLTSAEVKRAVVANGAASKAQVQRGVQKLLGLPRPPRPSHVADALGLAVIGLSRASGHLPG